VLGAQPAARRCGAAGYLAREQGEQQCGAANHKTEMAAAGVVGRRHGMTSCEVADSTLGPRDAVAAALGHAADGVYTCARCVGGAARQLAFHERRLAAGCARVGSPTPAPGEVAAALADAEREFRARFPGDATRPVLVTLFAGPENEGLRWHAMALPAAAPSVPLVAITAARTAKGNREGLPGAKNAAWVLDRVPLEQERDRLGAQELVMLDAAGERVLEGLVTNVVVVRRDGTLQTAPDGVLGGSMRELVIMAAIELRLPLQLAAPTLADARRGLWADLVLASATRPVVRAERVLLPDGADVALAAKEHPSTARLRAWVAAQLA
jgi:branched-subunit amino acid aminotransferase/4-amino-4-deoxychorismate lyase